MRTSVKYMVIYRHKDKYSISEMCRFFKVSRSGYYDYVKRMDTPARDLPLSEKIRECQESCGKTYGYRRIHIWLEKQGIHHNPKTILRVMQKYSLLSVVRRKKYRNYSNHIHKYENLLNRDFHADRPNQKWVTDISYIHTKQGVLYLSIIRDLYDNSIVAHKTGTEQNVNLVLNTIKEAKKKEKVTAELQLHSDQGFQYTSHGYFKLTHHTALHRQCQGVEIRMTMLWRKISFQFSKQNVSTVQIFKLMRRLASSLANTYISTIISVFN